MRILIVDDDLIGCELLKTLLKSYGECIAVSDGKQAIDAYSDSLVKNDPFQLVFLDIMMPEMNGHEVLERLRGMEEEQGILYGHGAQVVMTTALGDTKNVLSAFSEGCEYYLVKPVEKEKVFDIMKQVSEKANQS